MGELVNGFWHYQNSICVLNRLELLKGKSRPILLLSIVVQKYLSWNQLPGHYFSMDHLAEKGMASVLFSSHLGGYALIFSLLIPSTSTNNQAEYEAVLKGLCRGMLVLMLLRSSEILCWLSIR